MDELSMMVALTGPICVWCAQQWEISSTGTLVILKCKCREIVMTMKQYVFFEDLEDDVSRSVYMNFMSTWYGKGGLAPIIEGRREDVCKMDLSEVDRSEVLAGLRRLKMVEDM